jgi:hypothetical protein
MTDIHAAIGLAQLKKLDKFNAAGCECQIPSENERRSGAGRP